MRRVSFAVAVLVVLFPVSSLADGTLTTASLLERLAASNPKLVQTLRQGFELNKDAEGGVIGRAMSPALGGTRIGPYHVRGRLKGETGAMHLRITLTTEMTFFDKSGRSTQKVAGATRLTESLVSVTMEEVATPTAR